MEEMELTGESNTDLLLYSGVFPFNSLSTMLYSLAAIVIFLIMFGSISLIYNAFAISVSERTKQFGLLSSIGATKKQLKHMVLSEALMVSMVGIPLGILSGIGGIGITLFFLGSKFRTFGYPIDMKLCVSIPAILIAVVVALITVLLSAWVPSRRARKVSAVEAIRQTMDIQNTKPVKTSRLTYKIFGLSGMLASKYYKRSRKKYRATVLSLFMSIVLFVSASAFTGYLMESISGSFGSMNFDLCISISGEQFTSTTPEALLNQMGKAKSVTKAAFSQDYFTRLEVPASLMTEEGINFLKKNSADNTSGSSLHMYAYITFADDETYREVLKENNLKEADYMNPDQPLALVVDSITCFNSTKEKYETIRFFSQDSGEFTFSLENYEDSSLSSTLTTGKILETTPYFISSSYDPWLIYPLSLKEQVLAGLDAYAAVSNFILSSENPGESYSDLQTVLTDAGFNGRNLQNIAEREESERNLVSIIQVFSYGFIILISLIAAANVFNTISTNISLRRREFAMLKSVGMTRKGFQQMMNFECFLYGFKALLPGLPVSCCITYLIYLSIMEGYETTFRLPWKAILIAVASVFLVVFVTMMYSMNKINKENPIDALKNENL